MLKVQGVVIVQTCNITEAMLQELLVTNDKSMIAIDGIKSIGDALQTVVNDDADDDDDVHRKSWAMLTFRKLLDE